MATIPTLTLRDGHSIPVVGLGTYGSPESGDRDKVKDAVKDAIAAGYRHIDTAWCYDVEQNVGAGVREAIAEGLVKREDLFITTKLWMYFMKRDEVVPALKDSLKKLGLDYVDLFLVHWPMGLVRDEGGAAFPKQWIADDSADINSDTWPGMEECSTLGLAKSIGVSNFNSIQLEKLLQTAKIPPVLNQVESHPLLGNRKLIDYCKTKKIVVTAYSPMGGSPMVQGQTPVRGGLFDSELLKSLATKYNKSVSQILIKFQVARGISVIPKSVTKSRIIENVNIFDFDFTPDELNAIEQMDRGERHVGIVMLNNSKEYPFSAEF